MSKEWVIFVTRLEDLVEGQENVLTIRDLSPGQKKYNAKVVTVRCRKGALGSYKGRLKILYLFGQED